MSVRTNSRSRSYRALFAVLAACSAALTGAILFACSQTPTTVPVRTFERAQRLDTICLRVLGVPVPEPRPLSDCAPVPEGVDGRDLANQLFALVTQSSRGEIAVVDLSAGATIDQSRGTPGINFLPVGALPTDVAASADGRMAFVASAEPNKFAIYGIPGRRILGDTATVDPFNMPPDPEGPTSLTSWPVCALPQRPGALAVIERGAPGTPGAEAGVDAYRFELVAILPGDRSSSAKLVTIDPRPFLRGSAKLKADGTRDFEDFGPGPELAPGALAPCTYTSAVELVGESAVPERFLPGKTWDDGVKWVEGGVDLDCDQPAKAASCGPELCKCLPDGGAGTTCNSDDAGTRDIALTLGPIDPPKLVAVARDGTTLYIADEGAPLIHVVDLSTPGTARERPPLLATSIVDPSRTVTIRDLAVSPPTSEYKRFLYAVDKTEGSLLVYDVTDPATMDRTPMRRPHPEIDPFQPPDRLSFSSPVVAVAFARHDFPLSKVTDSRGNTFDLPSARTGVLCNPNPNLTNADFATSGPNIQDFGFFYRPSETTAVQVDIDPRRLRGIFAFVTLANGQVITIDVDDWDAPCRRPSSLTTTNPVSALASEQPPPTSASDFNPYHAPTAGNAVTDELFVPVSTPHRMRSAFFLRDDSTTGKHVPFLSSTPTGQTKTGSLPLVGQGSERTPRILPTLNDRTSSADVGIAFSSEAPNVHFDQDWSVTYEGALPGFEGFSGTFSSQDDYLSVVLSQPQGRFCSKGVEDWEMGKQRAAAVMSALPSSAQPRFSFVRRMVDYVQLTDEILDESDPYWSLPDDPGGCWDGVPPGRQRAQMCSNTFGAAADEKLERDFPIIEANDDRLVLGMFGVPSSAPANPPVTPPREVIYKDPWNAPGLKRMRCCFHHQSKFRIRAGSQWVTVGSLVGFLNHVVRGTGGRCVASCDPREALLNGRAPALPSEFSAVPTRDSPLAMRNPMFSFFMRNGNNVEAPVGDFIPARDSSWQFQTRGQFTPVTINLASTTTSVNPQSMRYIESLGQLAVVDGSSQGLVLIDLGTVALSTRGPYF